MIVSVVLPEVNLLVPCDIPVAFDVMVLLFSFILLTVFVTVVGSCYCSLLYCGVCKAEVSKQTKFPHIQYIYSQVHMHA